MPVVTGALRNSPANAVFCGCYQMGKIIRYLPHGSPVSKAFLKTATIKYEKGFCFPLSVRLEGTLLFKMGDLCSERGTFKDSCWLSLWESS